MLFRLPIPSNVQWTLSIPPSQLNGYICLPVWIENLLSLPCNFFSNFSVLSRSDTCSWSKGKECLFFQLHHNVKLDVLVEQKIRSMFCIRMEKVSTYGLCVYKAGTLHLTGVLSTTHTFFHCLSRPIDYLI